MCGIAGYLDTDGRPAERGLVTAMTEAIAHRGPDGSGVWLGGPVGLGHRRLAIRDLTDTGSQPITDASGGVVVTYNGELYNDAALRKTLTEEAGVVFQGTCDAEVIPAAYAHWGASFVDRLDGMFAFALWDTRAGILMLARDRFGIKPLYVGCGAGRLRFGSEIKALLADPSQGRGINPAHLHSFFAQGYVDSRHTTFADIRSVEPGTVETYDRSGTRTVRTYYTPARGTPDITTEADASDAFAAVWSRVVDRHLLSDVPVGVLQSGGIDSSLISMELARGGRAAVPTLFTASFAQDDHDESALAELVAKTAGAPLETARVDVLEDPAETFRRMVWHSDGQLADTSAFAFLTLSEAVSRSVKCVLAGDGADELFGGYPTYKASLLANGVGRLVPGRAAAAGSRLAARFAGGNEGRLPVSQKLARFLHGLTVTSDLAHAEWRRLIFSPDLGGLYGPALAACMEDDALRSYRELLRAAPGNLLDRCLTADQRHYLPADLLVKVDTMSMAHGLEVRVPFLDPEVVDLAARIDARTLLPRVGHTKAVLRRALADMGGPQAVIRGRKRGFNVPVARLLREGLAPHAEKLLLHEADRYADFLSPDTVRAFWQTHQARERNYGYVLWVILVFAQHLALLER